jgi:hypothetical protein
MIKPPTLVLEKPFTKAISVTISFKGAITIKEYSLPNSTTWQSRPISSGTLPTTPTDIEMGVLDLDPSERGRGILQIEGENWPDDWFGGSLQLVGKTPKNQPFIFGQADFLSGMGNVYPAPSVIHTATRFDKTVGRTPREAHCIVVTEPFVPKDNERTGDRIVQTKIVVGRAPTVAFVLWLESHQTGYIKTDKLPGFASAVKSNV